MIDQICKKYYLNSKLIKLANEEINSEINILDANNEVNSHSNSLNSLNLLHHYANIIKLMYILQKELANEFRSIIVNCACALKNFLLWMTRKFKLKLKIKSISL